MPPPSRLKRPGLGRVSDDLVDLGILVVWVLAAGCAVCFEIAYAAWLLGYVSAGLFHLYCGVLALVLPLVCTATLLYFRWWSNR